MKTVQILCFIGIAIILGGCGTNGKINDIKKEMASAEISISAEKPIELQYEETQSDTLTIIDLDGNHILLMKAMLDEKTGEMVATESIQAAVVTSRFSNVAERGGEVEIEFDISIPQILQDKKWQIRLQPVITMLGNTIPLEEIRITGKEYRESQLRGYEQYNKYISSIITDTKQLAYTNLIKVFIKRNIPLLAELEKDTSFVADSSVEGFYGITYGRVKEYYTKIAKKRRNEQKILNKGKKYKHFIKDPMVTSGIKLDSVITSPSAITYRYTHSIKTQAGLKKVEMSVGGSIFLDGKQIYQMPASSSLSFYISSLSTFTESKTMYVKKIVERRAQANTTASICFKSGKYDIVDTLFQNKSELRRINKNIEEILRNEEYDLDSIVVTASCSPEGRYTANKELAWKRADAIKNYLMDKADKYVSATLDTAEKIYVNHNITEEDSIPVPNTFCMIDVKTKSIPEEWGYLKNIILHDSLVKDKESIFACYNIGNLDEREKALRKCADYQYIRKNLYPKLRLVCFDFFLHRKGMVKDTIHTTEIDTIYQQGLLALQERNYEKAVQYLKPYSDFNTALALTSLNYNSTALSILEALPQSAPRDYMLAIIFSRQGNEQKAVQYYMNSLSQDRSMAFRGNLDPEVSRLIKKYQINANE